jgi:hypothetical protein
VPTCVAMLVLDHGRVPNFKAIKETNLANDSKAMNWIEEAGLKPKLTELIDKEKRGDVLSRCLVEHGPGILSVNHPEIGGHVIVLDAISKGENTAKIRDPFHGRSVTLKLDVLLSWVSDYFLQIDSSSQGVVKKI